MIGRDGRPINKGLQFDQNENGPCIPLGKGKNNLNCPQNF